MAGNPEIADPVAEFRSVVEAAIDQQVREAKQANRSWPGYDKVARAGDLTFANVNYNDARPHPLGVGSERLWGVHTGKLYSRQVKLSGHLAVISTIERPDILLRNWSFYTGMQMITADTQRVISDDIEMAAVIRWITSPHLQGDSLQLLGVLGVDEVEKVQAFVTETNETLRELNKDLEALARARLGFIPDTTIY